MTILLTCCKTHQSVIEKSSVIAKDTMAISRVAAKDSALLNAKIDSIIIEEYAVGQGKLTSNTRCGRNRKVSSYQLLKKKTKAYGANISGTWSSAINTMNKKMAHQQTTNSDIKQKTPIQTTAGGKKVYALIALAIILFVGYMNWKNAVQ